MIALVICALAFVGTIVASYRSLPYGLLSVCAVGYAYGILRANILSTWSHFIFDAAVFGLYLGTLLRPPKTPGRGVGTVRAWLILLIAWPVFVALLPFQTPMVTLVGLRGNVYLLPMILLGCYITYADLKKLGTGLALLNLGALAIAVAEYFVGIERFFPRSAVTAIMYASKDVAGATAYRIPGPFTGAHAYAATMACTIPILFTVWMRDQESSWKKTLLLIGTGAALAGIMLTATRTHFVIAALLVVAGMLQGGVTIGKRVLFLALVAGLMVLALTNERMQRFKSLGESERVLNRINGSVNRSFVEVLIEYPMGNGLGGGGTSLPYFLQGEVNKPIAIENEYGRILLEQGVLGLLIWIGFLGWSLTQPLRAHQALWRSGAGLAWLCVASYCATAMIGLGMLTSIPQTVLLLLMMGWTLVRPQSGEPAAVPYQPWPQKAEWSLAAHRMGLQ